MPSLRSFVTHAPKPLLQEFLQKHRIELEEEDLAGTATVVSAIERELSQLPPGTRGQIDYQIEKIDKLSNEAGEVAIENATVHDHLRELSSRHARALWVFLHDRDGFRRAEEIFYSDSHRYGREWTAFAVQKGCDLAQDEAAVEALRSALRAHFDTEHVQLDIFERSRPEFMENSEDTGQEGESTARLTQITIYHEVQPTEDLAFLPDGELGTQVRRPVIDAAITYEPSTGTIECVGARRDNRAELVRLVATNLLSCEADFQPSASRTFDLGLLRERVEFRTDPDDGIEDVRIAMLRLTPVDTAAERVTLESLPTNNRDIWSTVEERLGEGVLGTSYDINQVRLIIRYRSKDSNRLRSLPITITHPHRSNIKDRLEIERVVANKYLPQWGLLVS